MTLAAHSPTRPYADEPLCWIVTEGLAGTENQCIGVAEHLGLRTDVKRINLAQPWRALSPYLGLETPFIFSPRLRGPWPDLLLTAGRKSIAAARFIKKQSAGRTVSVHIQNPRLRVSDFDLIAVAAHDSPRGDNVIVTTAAPNRITQTLIDTQRAKFNFFEILEKPRIAVMIGGNSKAYRFEMNDAQHLLRQLAALKGSLLVTCSRRTPEPIRRMIETELTQMGHYVWNGQGENPYLAFLGVADFILVTADSVSMLSECCSTGKPVYMIPLRGGARRITAFHRNLMERGAMRLFEGRLETFAYEPLNDAKLVAEAIFMRFPALRPRQSL